MHKCPLPTVAGRKIAGPRGKVVTVNPFESMPTYSQRYKKVVRTMPKLEGKRYGRASSSGLRIIVARLTSCLEKSFFPPELHHLIDPSSSGTSAALTGKRQKARVTVDDMLGEDVDDPDKVDEDEDEEEVLEEQDNDFEEDEYDDEADKDDYNAEQYFDNGEEDDFDMGDDGGGGDYE